MDEGVMNWQTIKRKWTYPSNGKSPRDPIQRMMTKPRRYKKTIFSQSTIYSFFFDRSNQAANANEMLIAIAAPIQTIPSSIDMHQSINNDCCVQKH
tara:strand:+ start:197 stop:484 length:288 start_codon:yes stop_codon:yes gene_type:complete